MIYICRDVYSAPATTIIFAGAPELSIWGLTVGSYTNHGFGSLWYLFSPGRCSTVHVGSQKPVEPREAPQYRLLGTLTGLLGLLRAGLAPLPYVGSKWLT